MGFVDVEQGFSRINASYVDHPVDVGAVAVHAVYAFGDYQDCIEIGSLAGDDLREVVVVIVAETLEWSPGKAYAVDYAGVDEAVGYDECATVGDGLNESDVGMVAAVESVVSKESKSRCRAPSSREAEELIGKEAGENASKKRSLRSARSAIPR